MSYDDWKTDPEYGLSHADLREAELKSELQDAQEIGNRLIEENAAMKTKIAKMTDFLEELLDYCKDNYDVDPDPTGGHHDIPNWYMRTGTEIEEVLGKGGRYGF